MTDNYIGVQLKFNSGVKSPITTGDRRLTMLNLVKLVWGLAHGTIFKQGSSTLMVQDTLVQASATCTPATVTVGQTVTINGVVLTSAQRRASGTATAATVLENTTLTVNGVTFTAVNGAVVVGEATFDCSGSNTACATSIAAQVNGYADPRISGVIAAKSASAVVTFYAVAQGTTGNGYTLASSDGTTLAVSGATLANGAAVANDTFDFAGSNVTTGQALAYAINNTTTADLKAVTATASSSTGVVTIKAKVAGPAGNAITLTSSDGATLAVTGSGFLASGTAGAPTLWTI